MQMIIPTELLFKNLFFHSANRHAEGQEALGANKTVFSTPRLRISSEDKICSKIYFFHLANKKKANKQKVKRLGGKKYLNIIEENI
jgi:hypothetical protein